MYLGNKKILKSKFEKKNMFADSIELLSAKSIVCRQPIVAVGKPWTLPTADKGCRQTLDFADSPNGVAVGEANGDDAVWSSQRFADSLGLPTAWLSGKTIFADSLCSPTARGSGAVGEVEFADSGLRLSANSWFADSLDPGCRQTPGLSANSQIPVVRLWSLFIGK